MGIVVDAARRLADFTHRIGERLGLVAFQLAGGERQRLEADGTVLGGVHGLHGHADRLFVVEQLELEVGELRVTVVGVAERLVGGQVHGHVLRRVRVRELDGVGLHAVARRVGGDATGERGQIVLDGDGQDPRAAPALSPLRSRT